MAELVDAAGVAALVLAVHGPPIPDNAMRVAVLGSVAVQLWKPHASGSMADSLDDLDQVLDQFGPDLDQVLNQLRADDLDKILDELSSPLPIQTDGQD